MDPEACVEYDGLHAGVVRCVRWNDASPGGDESDFGGTSDGGFGGKWLFASCGGDGRVAVVDTRIAPSRAKVAGLDDAHGGRPVNFVEWGRRGRGTIAMGMGTGTGRGGGNGYYSLLTSGGDAFVRLWDLRALATSLDETRRTGDGVKGGEGDAPMTLALAREFTGHHRAGLTRPKTITRAVFVFHGDDAHVVTPGEQSRAVSLYRRGRSRGFEETTREGPHPKLGECVSRGDVGFDPTAVFSLGAPSNRALGESSSFGWSLALANKGEIRVYEPVREGGGGVGAGGASAGVSGG